MSNSSPEDSYTNHPSQSSDDEVVSIVHQSPSIDEIASSSDEAYAVFVPSQPSYAPERPLWLESFLTPWGFGSLLLILLANSLLSWAKWSQSYTEQSPTPATTSEASKNNIPPNSSAEETSTLSLDPLSTATPSKPPTTIQPPPQTINPSQAPTKSVAVVKPKTDLTSALLPPSVQPQFVPAKTIPQPTSPIMRVKTPRPQPTSPTMRVKTPIPAPVKPVDQLAAVQIPTSNTVGPAKMRTINERILEEMRLQEEKRRNMPFIEKVKAQKQAMQTRQNLNQVLDSLEQQRQIQPQSPVIPNTLVIDGQNQKNNTN